MNFELELILIIALIVGWLLVDIIMLIKKTIKHIQHTKKINTMMKNNTFPPLPPKTPAKPWWKKAATWIIIAQAGTLFLCAYLLLNLVNPLPQVIKTSPNDNALISDYATPIMLDFNVPVLTNNLEIHTDPELQGEWHFQKYNKAIPLARSISFTPSQTLPPNQKILVYLSYLSTPFHKGPSGEFLLTLNTPSLPAIANTLPQDGETNVLTDTSIQLNLDSIDSQYVDWEIETIPVTDFELLRNNPQTLRLTFKNPLSQDTLYHIKVYQREVTYNLADQAATRSQRKLVNEFSFQTVKPPLIANFTPQGTHIDPDTAIQITFDEAMNTQSVNKHISITPDTNLIFDWNSEATLLTITPQRLSKATTYEVKLQPNIQNATGGSLETPLTFSFTTLGEVQVLSFSPSSNATNIDTSPSLQVTFDQAVDHQSAQDKFSLSPNVEGSFSWQDNTMSFAPNTPLENQTTYTMTVGSDIKSIKGFNSTQSYTNSFTTKAAIFALNVPLYTQQESFTCNIAALRMLLGYRGVYLSEEAIKSTIGTNGSRGNGNPYEGYVENYGTYWWPIVDFANTYRPAQIFTDWTIADILDQVSQGNPVMVWAQNAWSTPNDISWTTPQGDYIHAINGMHSYIVKGYIGSKDNPSILLLNDPWRGDWSMSKDQFAGLFNYFKIAMIVY